MRRDERMIREKTEDEIRWGVVVLLGCTEGRG